tara:strand:- start:460 stop:882 length:423 start_codon:yes stop_codon:yes gene_type:complete
MRLKIKRLDKELPMPHYATDGAAGIDLYATESHVLSRGVPVVVSCGISIALEKGFEAQIRSRSGLAAKHGISVLNSPGTIDSDYRGEIKVILHCLGHSTIERGDRIAQMVIKSAPQEQLLEVEDLDETVRGDKGFGSTGT